MSRHLMCLACMFLITGLAASPAMAELIAYYPFNEGEGTTTADATGNGNDGTLAAGVAWVQGYQGGGVEFDTAGDRIVIGPIDPSAGTNAMTLAAWINWQGLGHSIGQQGIIGKRLGWDPGTGVKWFWQTNPAGDFLFRADSANGGGTGSFGWGNTLLVPYAGEWIHVALTWDNGPATQYINGESVSTGNVSFIDTADDTPVSIGCVDSTNTESFVGIMDEVRFYNHALSPEELIKAMTGDVISAFAPVPADAAGDVPRDITLRWASGELAATHNVYFGRTREDVEAADGAAPAEGEAALGLTVTEYDPEELLQFNETYYWRVDEVNGAPDFTVSKGTVWSFTAEPYSVRIPIDVTKATASSYSKQNTPAMTVDGSGLDGMTHSTAPEAMWLSNSPDLDPWLMVEFDRTEKLDQMLIWNSNHASEPFIGWGVKDVSIEYSIDGVEWTTLAEPTQLDRGPGLAGYNTPQVIDFGLVQAKFVRLNIQSSWGGLLAQYGLAELQFYGIPVRARQPVPASGSTDILPNTLLKWRAGRDADQHVIYASTEDTAVINGAAPSVTSGTSSLDLTSLDPQLGKTYYWRVDEVNEAETPAVWAGPVWSLSIPSALVVDDFERYGNLSPNRPFQTWLDGYGYSADEFFPEKYDGNGTGAGVGHDIWGPSSPHFDGDIMEMDTAAGGSQSLPFYYSNTASSASQMDRHWTTPQDWSLYGIQTLSISFYGDPNNTGTTVYAQINGKKVTYENSADLKVADWHVWSIDLASLGTNVSAITSLSIGVEGVGAGMILVDDITLYREAPALISAWYSLENNTDDVSGNGHDGMTVGDPVYVAGFDGMALLFDGTGSQYVDLGTFNPSDGTGRMSVSLWARWQGLTSFYQGLIGKRNTWSETDMMWQIEANRDSGQVGFAQTAGGVYPGQVLPIDEWAHVGVSFNGSTARVYMGGDEVGSGAFSFGSDTGSALQFGACEANGGNPFNGAIDEVKLYNRPLSAGEMRVEAGLPAN
ncbi:MAG: discoidin domain-containing protein [Phycisphaerae bacterium]|nr:discoidin domain-containing protein [Phycisphaerae bacterium]